MKFLDLFAGIGGFRMGMEQAGHESIGYVEIDKYARKSYEAIYDTKGEWTAHDITRVSDNEFKQLRGSVDVICGGFPCQAFSVAGKRGGFSDTRGTLFFEIARAAEQIKPSILLLENVKGLLSHDKGKTFAVILRTLDELGYNAEWQVINSKDYGVPQNRERVFIIGHLRGTGGREVFPIGGENGNVDTQVEQREIIRELAYSNGRQGFQEGSSVISPDGIYTTLKAITKPANYIVPVLTPDRLNKRQNGRRFKEDGEPMFTLTAQDRHGVAILRPVRTEYGKEIRKAYENGEIKESRHNMRKLEPRPDGISNTITTVQKDNLLQIKEATKKGYDEAEPGDSVNYSVPTSKTRRGRVGKKIANTLDTGVQQGVVTEKLRIRRLTPRETWRLQGFPDEAYDKAARVVSESQLYKQAGNAVTVNVVYEIAKRL